MMDDLFKNEQDIASFLLGKNQPGKKIKKVQFSPLQNSPAAELVNPISSLNALKLNIIAELGKTMLSVRDLLSLKKGDVLELDKPAGEMTDIYLNEQKFAQGEVLVINEVFGVRLNLITSIKKSELKEES
ncbi:MAG: FliM/FliN family flagellar motor switch protein [Dehalobacterium sp.]